MWHEVKTLGFFDLMIVKDKCETCDNATRFGMHILVVSDNIARTPFAGPH